MILVGVVCRDEALAEQLRARISRRATLVTIDPEAAAAGALESGIYDAYIVSIEPLTDETIHILAKLREACPDSVLVGVGGEEAVRRARDEQAVEADMWLVTGDSATQLDVQLETLVALLEARQASAGTDQPDRGSTARGWVGRPVADAAGIHSLLYRMVREMSGTTDVERLFNAYCDAVQHVTKCVSYCLLWQPDDGADFMVVRAEGPVPALPQTFRLPTTAPLVNWLKRTRGILTEAAEGTEVGRAVRQLHVLGGVLAVPLFCRAVLRGVMVVGPSALGVPYSPADAEAVFMLSSSLAAAVHQAELHAQLKARNKYIAEVISNMESGIITLGADGKIRVCNPYAASVLGLDQAKLTGADIRALPSPLGDFLYACLRYGEQRSREEVQILGGQVVVRVSTRRMTDAEGQVIGSMMFLEDITTERALAEERERAERTELINHIVARIAHELKNPLSTVFTFAELLPETLGDPEYDNWAELVRKDVHRLDDLIAKLVSLAEPPPTAQEVIEVPEMVQMALQRLSRVADEGVEYIATDIREGLPMVRVDPGAMAAAICHLLRYGLSQSLGPVRIEASLEDSSEETRPVRIIIRVPCRQELQEEPSRLLDVQYVLEHPELDLGPSVSQRLVESQGGTLEAHREGDSIVFKLSLPPYPAVSIERVARE